MLGQHVADRVGTVAQAQLAKGRLEVDLDRVGADPQAPADLGVAGAVRDQFVEDLTLPRGQRVDRRLPTGLSRTELVHLEQEKRHEFGGRPDDLFTPWLDRHSHVHADTEEAQNLLRSDDWYMDTRVGDATLRMDHLHQLARVHRLGCDGRRRGHQRLVRRLGSTGMGEIAHPTPVPGWYAHADQHRAGVGEDHVHYGPQADERRRARKNRRLELE